ncbi:MAG TPA: AsmA family protein [Rhodanobacteraceae bacterium]|nr:AsmA family protein [Rhodanobacteraceae bacterium]
MALARRILIWIVVFVAALVVVAILFVALFDWNRARPWMNQRLSASLGRPVAINGDLAVDWSRNPDADGLSHWVPWPRFTARDIDIANPAWAKRPRFATVEQVRFSLSPLALIGHTIEIPSLKLFGPSVDIERDKDGRANWRFNFAQGGGKWNLDIGEVGFDAGTIRIDDGKLDLHLDVAVQPLGKPVPFAQIVAAKENGGGNAPPPRTDQAYYFGWTAKGAWRGARASGSGKIGSVLALRNASMPFPLQADLRLRDVHIAMAGTLTDPVHLAALNLHLKMSADSMENLYPLTGLALPPSPPFATEGHLVGNIREGVFRYSDFDGHVGGSDLHGEATYATAGARPKLTGHLTSNVLKFSDLAPLVGADSNASKKRRGEAVKQPADKLLPVEPFDTARWRKMDADVTFTGKRILRKAQLPIQDLSTHAVMDDGVLTLDPLRFGVAGGDLDARITLDGRRDPMHGDMRVSVRRAQLKRLFPTVDLMKSSLGQINGDAALTGSGNSVAKLLGTSDGEVKLLVDNGAVSKLLLEEAGLNIANIITTKLFGDEPVKNNCAAADFKAHDGLWRSTLFLVDTETATINVDGTINLATEQLDLTLHPRSKGVRILSLRSPLYLRGTLKNPNAGVEKGPLLARGAGAAVLGTVAAPLAALAAMIAPSHKDENPCTGLIAQMRKPAKASGK